MKVALRYSDHTALPVKAACIRGSNIAGWLKEISRWEIPVDQMDCYLLPQSIRSVEAAGLFVIFKNATGGTKIDFLEPYCCIGEKIFLPVNTMLSPEINSMELKTIFRWPVQVFHPTIGLIGFEKEDAINLADMFFFGDPVQQDWSFAHPGILTRPAFNQINFMQPSAEELMKDIKEEIGQKSLFDIGKEKEGDHSAIEKIFDNIKYGVLKSLFAGAGFIGKILPEEGNINYNNSGKEGLFEKISKWLQQNLEELEKKRKDEISRLLNLFDENTDEALQYAIPLDSPYLNRGSSEPVSSRLSRNPLDFNLGRLGGGRRVDSWDVSDRYSELRAKYLKAAQKEIEQKDFKKAAYVYAHLLGDYNSAANVLEQGKMYREAAALHKDHLKNIPAAAECLERGALYNEAIELYKDLKKDEKIGDLYKILEQPVQAEVYYEKHIDVKISNNDYLDAARVISEKLEVTDRAKETLLEGWKHTYQAEACLKKYFDLVIKTDNETAAEKANTIFSKHTPKHKRLPFLNVLEYVHFKKNDEAFTAAAQEIAYEVAHAETEEGNVPVLHDLKKFFPNDKLIGSDTSRYTSSSRSFSSQSNILKAILLDESIQWVKAAWHRNQFLAVGIKNSYLHMVRGNWYGNLEYYSWTNAIKPGTNFNFINAPYYSNHIIIHSSAGIPITRKNLPKNKYFPDALVVNCPVWLHNGNAQFIINEQQDICKLEIAEGVMTLHHYNVDGELKRSVNCSFENDPPASSSIVSYPYMVNNGGFYYTYKDKHFIAVSGEGIARTCQFDTLIRFFSASHSLSKPCLIISTNKGCVLCRPEGGDLNITHRFFAPKITPSLISFITSNRFVITEKTKAFLFEIAGDTATMIEQFNTQHNIIAALPTSVRSQFALLEENGRMTLCEKEE